jgi:truncated hemoglobin YjbI
MTQAMEVVGIRPEMRAQLEASFANTADWMRNKDG